MLYVMLLIAQALDLLNSLVQAPLDEVFTLFEFNRIAIATCCVVILAFLGYLDLSSNLCRNNEVDGLRLLFLTLLVFSFVQNSDAMNAFQPSSFMQFAQIAGYVIILGTTLWIFLIKPHTLKENGEKPKRTDEVTSPEVLLGEKE